MGIRPGWTDVMPACRLHGPGGGKKQAAAPWRSLWRALWVGSLLIMNFVSPVYGRDFVVTRRVQGYTLDVAINQNPPILGRNDIRMEIKDALGGYVTDAPVSVNYFMPPMPGMAPMNYTVTASPGGSGYRATMDLIMKGPWNIVVKAKVAEQQIRMTILIDVR